VERGKYADNIQKNIREMGMMRSIYNLFIMRSTGGIFRTLIKTDNFFKVRINIFVE
jgi:hypothetical protein